MSAGGFGRSPATGKAVSDLVIHGETAIDIDGLRLGRFADILPDWREQHGWVPGVDTGKRIYAIWESLKNSVARKGHRYQNSPGV